MRKGAAGVDIDEINEHIRKLKYEETSWQSVN